MGEHIEEVKQIGNQVITTHHYKGWVQTGEFSWTWRNKKWDTTYWVPYTFTPAKTKKELKIIGLKNAYLQPGTSPYGMTLKKFDTASYVDRAILQLKNETAGNVVVRDISIRGEPVYQIAGQNGFIWEYSDYDSIDKNGEQFKEIGNDFIFDASQAESIGDFAWKLLKPHQVYTLALRGCQYQYQIGDVYTLNIDYSLDASSSQIELVNVDVEIIGISFERSVGSVGSTMLACRVDLGAWSKTTSRRAQLVGTGQANNNTNRTNTVTVASSTYTGTADYYCDGTDDHVEIQKAIDDIYAIGGGTVQLTIGIFTINANILVYDNIRILGNGSNTEIKKYGSTNRSIRIVGNNTIIECIKASNGSIGPMIDTYTNMSINKCVLNDTLINSKSTSTIYDCTFIGDSHCQLLDSGIVSNCIFDTSATYTIRLSGTNGSQIIGNTIYIAESTGIAIFTDGGSNNTISNNRIIGADVGTAFAPAYGIVFVSSSKNSVSSNNISGIVNTEGGGAYGIYIDSGSDRNNISGNTSLGCTTNYSNLGTNTTATGNIFA